MADVIELPVYVEDQRLADIALMPVMRTITAMRMTKEDAINFLEAVSERLDEEIEARIEEENFERLAEDDDSDDDYTTE